MSNERLSLGNIFDSILNDDGMWDEVNFKRTGKKVSVWAKDQYGTKYNYSEEFQ
jgi:hypothetical protein